MSYVTTDITDLLPSGSSAQWVRLLSGSQYYISRTQTDDIGTYTIHKVPNGTYVLARSISPSGPWITEDSAYVVALNPANGPYGTTTGVTVGVTSVNAQSEGVDMTGAAFSDTAWAAALAKLPSGGGQIFLPPGIPKFNAQLAFSTKPVTIKGSGMATTQIKCATQLGAGTPFVLANYNTNALSLIMEDLALIGPGPSITLGSKTANCDGLKANYPVAMDRVDIEYFDAGFISASAYGHVRCYDLGVQNCYYGLFTTAAGDAGDCFYESCSFNGNAMAGIACPSPGTMDRPLFKRCHLGFQPYAVYQEAGVAGGSWLNAPEFEHPVFEAIGNGVFYTENVGNSRSFVHGMKLDGLYHSWNASYKIAARVKDYAMVLGHIDGTWRYDPQLGSNPLTAGTINVWNIGSNSGATFIGNPLFLNPTDFASGWVVGGMQPTLSAQQNGTALSTIQEFPAYGAFASFPLQYSRIMIAVSALSTGAGVTLTYPKAFGTANRFGKTFDNTGIASTTAQTNISWAGGLGPATGLIIIEGF